MRLKRFVPRRYQLNKEAARVALQGHPWIFRSHLSTAADVFADGQWIELVGADNETLGHGVYEKDGLIGIKILKRGASAPDTEWIKKTVAKALARRKHLREYSDAFRAVHGENDSLPGIVVDVYKDTAVLQTYAPSIDSLGRYVAALLRHELGLKNVIWKLPVKRKRTSDAAKENARPPVRVLHGAVPETLRFKEGKLALTVGIGAGQKSGTFLDLRGLRKWLASQKFQGKRVLNLFAYTGTLGLAAETAGAAEVWNVDISEGALGFAKKHHSLAPKKHRFVTADIFPWLKELPEKEKFDVIIVDPPMMAGETKQVPNALRAYKQLYKAAVPHLKPRGTLIAACCTSRIARKRFRTEVDGWLPRTLKFKKEIQPEDDHPVGFPEGDYLKILVYESA